MSSRLPLVMVFGTFDLLHEGHRFVLREAMKRGNVIVIVAQDHNVQHIKGMKPVESQLVRMSAIQKEFPSVDVRAGDENDFLKPLREVQPDLIVLGYDQKLPPNIHERDLLCPIERLPSLDPHLHKSSLKRLIIEGKNGTMS